MIIDIVSANHIAINSYGGRKSYRVTYGGRKRERDVWRKKRERGTYGGRESYRVTYGGRDKWRKKEREGRMEEDRVIE